MIYSGFQKVKFDINSIIDSVEDVLNGIFKQLNDLTFTQTSDYQNAYDIISNSPAFRECALNSVDHLTVDSRLKDMNNKYTSCVINKNNGFIKVEYSQFIKVAVVYMKNLVNFMDKHLELLNKITNNVDKMIEVYETSKAQDEEDPCVVSYFGGDDDENGTKITVHLGNIE